MHEERWYVLIQCDHHEHAELVQCTLRCRYRRPTWRLRVIPAVSTEVISDEPAQPYPAGGHDAIERELDHLNPTLPPPIAEAATEEPPDQENC